MLRSLNKVQGGSWVIGELVHVSIKKRKLRAPSWPQHMDSHHQLLLKFFRSPSCPRLLDTYRRYPSGTSPSETTQKETWHRYGVKGHSPARKSSSEDIGWALRKMWATKDSGSHRLLWDPYKVGVWADRTEHRARCRHPGQGQGIQVMSRQKT